MLVDRYGTIYVLNIVIDKNVSGSGLAGCHVGVEVIIFILGMTREELIASYIRSQRVRSISLILGTGTGHN